MQLSQFPKRLLWLDFFSKKNEADLTVMSMLRSNQLFSKLTRKELALVSKLVHMRNYEAGEAVFTQDEKGLGMYIIAKGTIDIRMRAHDNPAEEVTVATLEPGSFFGELALTEQGSKRSASAYAHDKTVLVGFFRPDLMEIMERKPETGVKILLQLCKVLGKRLSETSDALTRISRELYTHESKKAA